VFKPNHEEKIPPCDSSLTSKKKKIHPLPKPEEEIHPKLQKLEEEENCDEN